jgi:hypothetical protein
MTATAPLLPPSTTTPLAVTPKEAAHMLSICMSLVYKPMRSDSCTALPAAGATHPVDVDEDFVGRQLAASAGVADRAGRGRKQRRRRVHKRNDPAGGTGSRLECLWVGTRAF